MRVLDPNLLEEFAPHAGLEIRVLPRLEEAARQRPPVRIGLGVRTATDQRDPQPAAAGQVQEHDVGRHGHHRVTVKVTLRPLGVIVPAHGVFS
jgi:hypothetical protein